MNTQTHQLRRSHRDRVVAGVCGGLAEYFDIDVSIVRLLFVAFDFVTGLLPLFLFYIIAWIVVPVQPKPQA